MPDNDLSLNAAARWDAPPLPGAALELAGITATRVPVPDQHLVSGDLEAFARHVAALSLAAPPVTLRLGRDRLLALGDLGGLPGGWHDAGFALSPMGAGLSVIELRGPRLAALMARAVTQDPEAPGRSQSTLFAGVPAILDPSAGRLRLHVERGLETYLWTWLRRVLTEMAGEAW